MEYKETFTNLYQDNFHISVCAIKAIYVNHAFQVIDVLFFKKMYNIFFF